MVRCFPCTDVQKDQLIRHDEFVCPTGQIVRHVIPAEEFNPDDYFPADEVMAAVMRRLMGKDGSH